MTSNRPPYDDDGYQNQPGFTEEDAEALRAYEEMLNSELDASRPERPEISTTLAALTQETGEVVNVTVAYGLSDLTPDEIEQLLPVWAGLPIEQRRRISRGFAEAGETNFDLAYGPFAQMALDDPDGVVRLAAVEILSIDPVEDALERLIELAQTDESLDVRAAACTTLGSIIYEGELGDAPDADVERAQETVIAVWNNPHELPDVRRRALEALANSSHPLVPEYIHAAYLSDEPKMRESAVFAMGRTCDAAWTDIVLKELESDNSAMAYEAARAAGEIMIEEAIPALKRLAYQGDIEIRDVAIWSLGEIGGREATRALELLAKDAKRQGDADLEAWIDDALGNAALGGMMDQLMFEFDAMETEDDDEDWADDADDADDWADEDDDLPRQ